MAPETTTPSPEEAREALASVQTMTARGLRRGLYPRWYAVAISLWGGSLSATIGTIIWPFVFAGGLLAYYFWRKQADIWLKEIRTKRDLVVMLLLSAPIGALFVGAYIGQQYYALAWAPLVAGIIIAIMLFAITEMAYRPIRTNQSGA